MAVEGTAWGPVRLWKGMILIAPPHPRASRARSGHGWCLHVHTHGHVLMRDCLQGQHVTCLQLGSTGTVWEGGQGHCLWMGCLVGNRLKAGTHQLTCLQEAPLAVVLVGVWPQLGGMPRWGAGLQAQTWL
jgi:hypothetical protein